MQRLIKIEKFTWSKPGFAAFAIELHRAIIVIHLTDHA
jgi:hypothetical protein